MRRRRSVPRDTSAATVRGVGWGGYLAGFHERRPGITDEILGRSRDTEANDPYTWMMAAAPPQGRLLDVAAGRAPLRDYVTADHAYLGLDASAAETRAARRGPVVRADATALPVASGSIDVVVCSMALMLFTPLPVALAEIRRVLRPHGRFVAMVPASGPLQPSDLPIVAGLLSTLGRRLTYPNDLDAIRMALRDARLWPARREQRRFGLRLRGSADADRFLESLYLPAITERRYQAARWYLRRLARLRAEMPIPLQRITVAGCG